MKAIILAGGRGTRLEPVTHGAYPKPLAEILGRPLLEHTLRHLSRCGFSDICITLACMPEQITCRFGDGEAQGLHLTYRREKEPLGTAGAVKNCRDFYGDQPFLVISGDALCDLDLAQLRREHVLHGSAVTMALYPHEAPLPYGLAITDTAGRIRYFVEKPRWSGVVTDLVNTGIYVISPRAMELVPEGTAFDFGRDLFPLLLRRGEELRGVALDGYWRDIGDPGSYYRANLDAWEGKISLAGAPDPAHRPPEEDAASPYTCRVFLPAMHRARLMRELSADLMEAGADFSHGLTVDSVPGGVHIAPCAGRDAITIESDDPDTVHRFEALAKRMEERIGGQ